MAADEISFCDLVRSAVLVRSSLRSGSFCLVRVWDLGNGFSVQGLKGFKEGSGFSVQNLKRIYKGFRIWGSGFRVCTLSESWEAGNLAEAWM